MIFVVLAYTYADGALPHLIRGSVPARHPPHYTYTIRFWTQKPSGLLRAESHTYAGEAFRFEQGGKAVMTTSAWHLQQPMAAELCGLIFSIKFPLWHHLPFFDPI